MSVSKSMAGAPWHSEYLRMDEVDTRRHKSNCIYNQDNQCRFYHEKCRGSAHCDEYQEGEKPKQYSTPIGFRTAQKKKRNVVHKNPKNYKYPEISKLFTVGDEIKERYTNGGRMRMRHGKVVKIDANKVTIEFTDKKGKPYQKVYFYPDMMKDIFI